MLHNCVQVRFHLNRELFDWQQVSTQYNVGMIELPLIHCRPSSAEINISAFKELIDDMTKLFVCEYCSVIISDRRYWNSLLDRLFIFQVVAHY